ncbi:hypothetical protein TeGR_g914, partial [Tetraparma gracilis]
MPPPHPPPLVPHPSLLLNVRWSPSTGGVLATPANGAPSSAAVWYEAVLLGYSSAPAPGGGGAGRVGMVAWFLGEPSSTTYEVALLADDVRPSALFWGEAARGLGRVLAGGGLEALERRALRPAPAPLPEGQLFEVDPALCDPAFGEPAGGDPAVGDGSLRSSPRSSLAPASGVGLGLPWPASKIAAALALQADPATRLPPARHRVRLLCLHLALLRGQLPALDGYEPPPPGPRSLLSSWERFASLLSSSPPLHDLLLAPSSPPLPPSSFPPQHGGPQEDRVTDPSSFLSWSPLLSWSSSPP